jgi:hypothetical protein
MMRCLKIEDKYVRLILEGKKTWEIRLRPNSISERIAIGSTKTKKVEGYVNLYPSQKASIEQLLAHPEKHQAGEFIVPYAQGRSFLYYWPVSKPEVETEPYPYSFSTGSWCKADKVLSDDLVRRVIVEGNDVCDKCHRHQAMHSEGNRKLCCGCYIEEGNPPADWHSECMQAYRSYKKSVLKRN